MPTVNELRTQLKKRGLPTNGRKAELEKRLDEAEMREMQENKHTRTMVNSVANEWLCPITTELPIDPVIQTTNGHTDSS